MKWCILYEENYFSFNWCYSFFYLFRIIFTSKPKLSIYLCLLMIVGSITLFFSTVGRFTGLSVIDEGVFNHIDGRVVISKRDSSVITDKILEEFKGISDVGKIKRVYGTELLLSRSVDEEKVKWDLFSSEKERAYSEKMIELYNKLKSINIAELNLNDFILSVKVNISFISNFLLFIRKYI